MIDFTMIAFASGLILGSIATARICAWWYGRQIGKTETRTKKQIAAKLASL